MLPLAMSVGAGALTSMPRRSTGALVTQEATSRISRRHQLVFLCGYLTPRFADPSAVQPLATDFSAGKMVKIYAEHGEVTLRRGPIAHVHLSARTTISRYMAARAIFPAQAGRKARFRVDRFERMLRLGPSRARYHQVQLTKNGVNRA